MADDRLREVLASIGANVRRRRLRRGLTQEGLAELASVEPRTVQAVERGRTNLSIGILVCLADALEAKPQALLRPSELPPPQAGRPRKKKPGKGRPSKPARAKS